MKSSTNTPDTRSPLARLRLTLGGLLLLLRVLLSFAAEEAQIATTAALARVGAGYAALLRVLDRRVFPAVVAYATHPIVIVVTILLLIPLILDASNTALVLTLGNYTNVCSAAVSSIVLLQSLKHRTENKRLHDQHTSELARLHQKLDDLTNQR